MKIEEYKDAMCMWFSDAIKWNTDHFTMDLLFKDMPEHKEGRFDEIFIDLPAALGYTLDAGMIHFRADLDGVNVTWHRNTEFSEMEALQKACYEN